MYIDKKYLSSEFEEPSIHLKEILHNALINMRMDKYSKSGDILDYYKSLETLKCINDFCSLYFITPIDTLATIPYDANGVFQLIEKYYTRYILTTSASDYSNHFQKRMYELTNEEFSSIQSAIDNLRRIIQNANIDDKQKERVLKKLEAMQKELHQKMSNYDKFLGGIISLSTTLGKSAEEAKPLLDYIHDVIKTILGAQQRKDSTSEETLQIEVKNISQIGHTPV